jgi:hypothetical protein
MRNNAQVTPFCNSTQISPLCCPVRDVAGSRHYHCNLSSANHLHKCSYFPKLPGYNSSTCLLHTIVHPNLICELPKYSPGWRLLRYFRATILSNSLCHYRSTCRNAGYFGISVLPFYQTLSATTEVHARMPVTSVTASAHPSNLIKNTEVIAYLPFTSVFPISRHSSSWPTSPSKGAVFSHPHNSSAASHLSLNRGTKIIFDRETFAVRPRN